ncbi:hypothetical protein KSP40_PGU010422 [Platanthera guangdongensis]|uniref:Ribosomal protein S18 n=1 Tax=Platanthera guangdongensis TaxID=2320717 RepID=A0ABR2MFM5_9ASPA
MESPFNKIAKVLFSETLEVEHKVKLHILISSIATSPLPPLRYSHPLLPITLLGGMGYPSRKRRNIESFFGADCDSQPLSRRLFSRRNIEGLRKSVESTRRLAYTQRQKFYLANYLHMPPR